MARWYKHEPLAWLEGVMKLTPEERGVYQTILDLIYLHNGPVAMDFQWLGGICNCDRRVMRRVVNKLVELGKLGIDGEYKLFNNRATVTLAEIGHRGAQCSIAGRLGGLKSSAARSKINGMAQAPAQAHAEQTRLVSKSLTYSVTTSEPITCSPELLAIEARKRPTPKEAEQ